MKQFMIQQNSLKNFIILQENVQVIGQVEHSSQRNDQEDTQPTLEHLTEQFLKSYEVEIAQVLGNLGNSIVRGTNNP
jgi:hypothetical protein